MMPKSESDLIGTAEAGASLGITSRQVIYMIESGLLPAQRIGRDFLINRADLVNVPKVRKRGPKPRAKKARQNAAKNPR